METFSSGGRSGPVVQAFRLRRSTARVSSEPPTRRATTRSDCLANDNRGANFGYSVDLGIAPNRAPPVLKSLETRVIPLGSAVDIDTLQGGLTFGADPEGDGVIYTLALSQSTHGLAVSGTRVVGTFDSPGAVRARIKAADALGSESIVDFVIAVAGPEPGRPVLPTPSYIYDPADSSAAGDETVLGGLIRRLHTGGQSDNERGRGVGQSAVLRQAVVLNEYARLRVVSRAVPRLRQRHSLLDGSDGRALASQCDGLEQRDLQ